MSPKFTLATVSRIFTHCGQPQAIELLVAVREDFLRTISEVAAENAAGKAKANKVSFGDAKLKEVLKAIGPTKDNNKEVRDEWLKFTAIFLGAWAMAVGTEGNVPLTPNEKAERDARGKLAPAPAN